MESLTKQQVQLQLLHQIDELFATESWDTFKHMLDEITGRLLSLDYSPRYATSHDQSIKTWKDRLLKQLADKYVNGVKVPTDGLAKEIKFYFLCPVMFSNLPGEPFSSDEMKELLKHEAEENV